MDEHRESVAEIPLEDIYGAHVRDLEESSRSALESRALQALSDLSREHADLRAEACRVLGLLGDHDHVLADSVEDPNPRVRSEAVAAISRHASDQLLGDVIARALDDLSPYVVTAALDLLTKVPVEGFNDELGDLIADENSWVRAAALRAAGSVGVPSVRSMIRDGLEDSSVRVRRAALRAISLAGDASFEEDVLSLFPTHPNERIQSNLLRLAINALVSINAGDEARERLTVLLDHPGARTLAAKGLTELPTPDARPRLERALSDQNAALRVAALQALAQLPAGPGTDLLAGALEDPEEQVRVAGLHVSTDFFDPELRNKIVTIARSGGTWERAAALRAYTTATGDVRLAQDLFHDPNRLVSEEADALLSTVEAKPEHQARSVEADAVTWVLDVGNVERPVLARLDMSGSEADLLTSTDLDRLTETFFADLGSNPIVLGVTAPLWLPVASQACETPAWRPHDSVSWVSPSAASHMASAVGLVGWLFRLISRQRPQTRVSFDKLLFMDGEADLLVVEVAFTEGISQGREMAGNLPSDLGVQAKASQERAGEAAAAVCNGWFTPQLEDEGATGGATGGEGQKVDHVVSLVAASAVSAALPIIGPNNVACEHVTVSMAAAEKGG